MNTDWIRFDLAFMGAVVVLSILVMCGFCISYRRAADKAKALEAQGKEVPESFIKRREYVRRCHEKFQANRKLAFLLCLGFVLTAFLIGHISGRICGI